MAKDSGITRGYTNSVGLSLYTDGERFEIRRMDQSGVLPKLDRVVLTKEEMHKVLRLFAPYFNNHDFGIADDG